MLTFILISGIIILCLAGIALWGAYDAYQEAEEYKLHVDDIYREETK